MLCHFMKTNLKQLLIIGASSLLFVGCCTTRQATKWEYKIVRVGDEIVNLRRR